ncbi:MAG TPA: NTF2 fold immunity protein [Chthoniobacteraceae bacterium]|jgi:hypothetical protein
MRFLLLTLGGLLAGAAAHAELYLQDESRSPIPLLLGVKNSQHNVRPQAPVVPNKATAIKISVAVWEPIYGGAAIASQRPYRATLANGVWRVRGSRPKGSVGGVALAEIQQADGRVLRITHGK